MQWKSKYESFLNAMHGKKRSGRLILGLGNCSAARLAKWAGVTPDFAVVWNTACLDLLVKNASAGILPLGNANDLVLQEGEKLDFGQLTYPIFVGACGTDPVYNSSLLLRNFAAQGYSGVQNYPSIGYFQPHFRSNLEKAGVAYDAELTMLEKAGEMGLLTAPVAFTVQDAKKLMAIEPDFLVLLPRPECPGGHGFNPLEAAERMNKTAKRLKPDSITLYCPTYGAAVEDVMAWLRSTPIDGIFDIFSDYGMLQAAEAFRRLQSTMEEQS